MLNIENKILCWKFLVTLAVVYYLINPNYGFIRVIIKYAKKVPVHRCAASAQFRTQITIVIFWQFIISYYEACCYGVSSDTLIIRRTPRR